MKELSEYTDDELSKEIERRRIQKGADILAASVNNFCYWEGKIKEIKTDNSRKSAYAKLLYKIEPKDKNINCDIWFNVLSTLRYKMDMMPKVGDIVQLRYRTHRSEDRVGSSRIVSIIKKA